MTGMVRSIRKVPNPKFQGRRGGRKKRFDTKMEKFWASSEKKAAVIKWGLAQPVPLEYSDVMRLAVDEFIANHKLVVPSVADAVAFLVNGSVV